MSDGEWNQYFSKMCRQTAWHDQNSECSTGFYVSIFAGKRRLNRNSIALSLPLCSSSATTIDVTWTNPYTITRYWYQYWSLIFSHSSPQRRERRPGTTFLRRRAASAGSIHVPRRNNAVCCVLSASFFSSATRTTCSYYYWMGGIRNLFLLEEFNVLLDQIRSRHTRYNFINETILFINGIQFIANHHLYKLFIYLWNDEGKRMKLETFFFPHISNTLTPDLSAHSGRNMFKQMYVHLGRVGNINWWMERERDEKAGAEAELIPADDK